MSQSQNPRAGKASAMIFVVDDEPMLLDMAVAILQPAGFQVRVFRDPGQALAEFAAAQTPPQVLVTDYSMGGMTGLDLIRECKRLQPRQKSILLSGTVDADIYADSPVKPDRFLAKPYQIHELMATIQELLAERSEAAKLAGRQKGSTLTH
jgi:two-component system, response regulator YesN